MKHLTWVLMVVGIVFIGISCKGRSRVATEAMPADTFQRGILHPGIHCGVSAYTYALYLPVHYDSTRRWPVIIAFDPGGDGTMPLSLCRDEADKRGYILLGSNDSRNGLPYQSSMDIFAALLADADSRFSLDPARIYLMGFSGGARVAGAIALTTNRIKAVIGCSAGLPDIGKPVEKPFDYLGVTGMSDMNFLEMRMLFERLDNTSMPHFLLLNEGKHAWPPVAMIPEVFDWLDVKAMKSGLLETDRDFLATLTTGFQRELAKARLENDVLAAEYVCRKAVHYLEGFPQADIFVKNLAAVRAGPDYAAALAARDAVIRRENDAQLQYTADLYTQTPAWWKDEVSRLGKLSASATSRDEKMMVGRLLGFLSLSTYTLVNQTMRSGAWDAAVRYNLLYAIIDPTNAEHAYLAAVLSMKTAKTKEALKSLQQAIDLGFHDAERMRREASFSALREKPEFKELISKAEKNLQEKSN